MSKLNAEENSFRDFLDFMFSSICSPRVIEKDYNISKNVNSDICSECGGECCKKCGCHYSPDDFDEISFESLKKELEKGYISIDYVDGEMIYERCGVYILRVRNEGAPIVDIGYNRGTSCILLTDKGCKLDYEQRPTGGKLLIPSANTRKSIFGEIYRECHSNYSIKDCCFEWRKHQKIIRKLCDYFEGKDNIQCSL